MQACHNDGQDLEHVAVGRSYALNLGGDSSDMRLNFFRYVP
jgi:hypothetical protein